MENLIQQALGNRWWGSFKYRIRDFAIKYCQRLALDMAKTVNALDDKLTWAVDVGYPLEINLERRDLEHKANKCYQGYIELS